MLVETQVDESKTQKYSAIFLVDVNDWLKAQIDLLRLLRKDLLSFEPLNAIFFSKLSEDTDLTRKDLE